MYANIVVPLTDKFFLRIKKNPQLLKYAEEATLSSVKLSEKELTATIISRDRKSDIIKMRDFLLALSLNVNEEDAKKIISQDQILYIIDLRTIFTDKESIKRVLGRIIGENGKIKNKISEITECSVYIVNSKIVLIGNFDDVEYAKNAIQIIVDGSPHSRLFKYLDKVLREKKMKEFGLI